MQCWRGSAIAQHTVTWLSEFKSYHDSYVISKAGNQSKSKLTWYWATPASCLGRHIPFGPHHRNLVLRFFFYFQLYIASLKTMFLNPEEGNKPQQLIWCEEALWCAGSQRCSGFWYSDGKGGVFRGLGCDFNETGRANPTVMVISQCSKQRFQPHHPGVSETPPLDFIFLNKFIGKMAKC